MKTNSIAILTDSCSDIPQSLLSELGIYQLSLLINYQDHSYRDRIDITADKVYQNLEQEIPYTSLPSLTNIKEIIQTIIDDGYSQIIIPVISSGLSGTFNAIQKACEDFDDIDIAVIDTKNIAIGSGFISIYAAQLVAEGLSFQDIITKLEKKIPYTHILYSLKTLSYLSKGGRLGKVEGVLGNILNIKPIIACNEQGIYYTVERVRGRKQSLKKMMDIVEKKLKNKKNYYLAICHGYAEEEAAAITRIMRPYINRASLFIEGQISPALGVHTGPGLIGIGYFELDD